MRQRRIPNAVAILCLACLCAAAPARAHEGDVDTLARLDAELAATPLDAELWRTRAVLERRRANYERAHADLSRAVELGLDRALALRDRGLVLLDERRFAEAEVSLRTARSLAPGDAPTLLAHARSLAGLGRWNDAGDVYALLVEREPRVSPDVHLERVRAIESSGGPDALATALRAADAALAALGPVPALQQIAIEIAIRAGDVDGALARLDRATAGRAGGEALLQRAAILERAGRQREANDAYAAALASLAALPEARRGTAASQQLEGQARAGLDRLAQGGMP